MTYFARFGMTREPFGTTPDPAMFYRTLGHEDCYERLKLAIALRRGLSVIIGDVGYGKTTIKVALLQELTADPTREIGIINNPRDCRTDVQFLRAVLEQFGLEPAGRTALDLTTEFLRYLEAMHIAGRNPLLVIDEGQNLSGSHLEILRTFLSFETPTSKLVDVVMVTGEEGKRDVIEGADIGQHLARHDVNVEVKRIVAAGNVQSTLLSYAADSSADMIVMGGYGHSRLREFILGGVTREMLQSMTVPCFMSH